FGRAERVVRARAVDRVIVARVLPGAAAVAERAEARVAERAAGAISERVAAVVLRAATQQNRQRRSDCELEQPHSLTLGLIHSAELPMCDEAPTSRQTPFIPNFARIRSTSATPHAWATQPRCWNGGSASKISLMLPIHPSSRWAVKPST